MPFSLPVRAAANAAVPVRGGVGLAGVQLRYGSGSSVAAGVGRTGQVSSMQLSYDLTGDDSRGSSSSRRVNSSSSSSNTSVDTGGWGSGTSGERVSGITSDYGAAAAGINPKRAAASGRGRGRGGGGGGGGAAHSSTSGRGSTTGGWGAAGASGGTDTPQCTCGLPSRLATVSKDTENKGRQFFSCSKPRYVFTSAVSSIQCSDWNSHILLLPVHLPLMLYGLLWFAVGCCMISEILLEVGGGGNHFISLKKFSFVGGCTVLHP